MKAKRIISLLLSAAMLLTFTACSQTAATPSPSPKGPDTPGAESTPDNQQPAGLAFTPGTYEAETPGRNGTLRLCVTVDETSILSVDILDHSETATLSDTPLTEIPAQIVKYQTLNVDTITGATLTSYAVLRAAENALGQAGGDLALLKAPVEKEKTVYEDTAVDVVVVGAGAAGMTAAIKAAEAGAKVLVVEKQGFLGGGDSMFSSTSIRVGGSRFQPEESQSAQAFYEYLEAQALKYRPDVCDLEAVRIYADRSGELVDWLTDLGAPYGTIVPSSFSIKTLDGSAPGPHNIRVMSERLEALGVESRVNTRATSILMEGGKAVGVAVEDPNGSYEIRADATIICTGGYSNNLDLVAQYAPDWLNRPTTGASSCTGDGILMAEAIGAKITNMDQVKANALCYVLGGVGISLTAITDYAVLVNHQGQRFMNERGGTVIGRAEQLMKQSGNEAYAIFDQTVIDELKLIAGYNSSGYFFSADTFEELAAQLDVDKDAFLATMEAYQEAGKTGFDEAFEKEIYDPIDTPKYYAALVTPSMQSTYGGITVDHSCRVLDTNDRVIPGLYAAGATSGHGCCAGEVGAALIVAFVYGAIAGETAAAEIG